MTSVRGSKNHKSRMAIAGLTAGALLTVARPALVAKVFAAGNSYDWERQEDVDRLGGSYSSAARSADGNHLILGVTEGGEGQGLPSPLYISNNGGDSWENVAPELDADTRNMWSSVDVSDDGETMVAVSEWGMDVETAHGRNGKIFVSENSGADWSDVTPESADELSHVVVSGDGSKIVAVDDGNNSLHISENGGESWTTPDTDEFWEIRSISISDDGDSIFVGGENSENFAARLFVTENNGTSWNDIGPGETQNLYDIKHDVSSDGNTIVVATTGWEDGDTYSVYLSEDAGENWQDISTDIEDTVYWKDVAVSDDGSRFSLLGSDGHMLTSSNSGETWAEEDPGMEYEDGNNWVDADFNGDGTHMIAAGQHNTYITEHESESEPSSVNLVNAENGGAILITTPDGTTITCHTAVKESSLAGQDALYQYPLGLVDFCFDTDEESNEVTLTFATDLKANQVAIRKYNPNTNEYTDVPGATVSEIFHEGHPALQITYTIVDNGPLDLDPDVGEIADPVGVGIAPSSESLAETGESTALRLFIASLLISAGFSALGLRKHALQNRRENI